MRIISRAGYRNAHDNKTLLPSLVGSCNIMGNTKTLKITRGKEKIKWVFILHIYLCEQKN